jgi:hypothetical protein
MAENSNSFTETLNTSTKTSTSFKTKAFATAGVGVGFSVAISGTFVAKWRLQRSLDGVTWFDFVNFTRPDMVDIPQGPAALWRVSAAGSGDFTSGSAEVSFMRGGSDAAMPMTRLQSRNGDITSPEFPLPVANGTNYETVAASQTDQIMGATGAVGDYLAGVLIVPGTTSPGAVSIKDGNGSAISIFAGGAASVTTLHPFFVPIGAKCNAAT